MIVSAIIAAEVAFWVVLAAGLATRYLLRMRRTSVVLLLAVPLVDVALLVVTAVDVHGGAEPSTAHGLAALYLGFTVAYGHTVIAWADRHMAHRLGGGPKPVKVKRYGWERAWEEWRLWGLTLIAVAISLGVLQVLIRLAEDGGAGVDALHWAESTAVRVLVIHGVVALSYTVWRTKPPEHAGERT